VTIWICRCRMNTLVTSQYQPRLSSITKILSRRISQSDWNIQIELNYLGILIMFCFQIQDLLSSSISSKMFYIIQWCCHIYISVIVLFKVNMISYFVTSNNEPWQIVAYYVPAIYWKIYSRQLKMKKYDKNVNLTRNWKKNPLTLI
jgi:hypothetical protein